jgi:RND family efflux transporter MFP subunit
VVATRDLPLVVEAVGRMTADHEVVVSAEVSGVAAGYEADVGDAVTENQVLVRLDEKDYRLALAEAKAALAQAAAVSEAASKTYGRMRTLVSTKTVTQDQFDQAEAEYRSAAAALARAKAVVDITEEKLKKTTITAPFAGRVASRSIERGQIVAPGSPLFQLVDLTKVRIKVHLSEKDFVHLDPDDPVIVSLDIFPGKSFPGRLGRIGVAADPRTNTFEAEMVVDNPDFLLKAGMTARVRLTTRILTGAVLIPQATVLYRENWAEVFVVDPQSHKARGRTVRLGLGQGDQIQVLEGLTPGDRLVVTGSSYLKEGDPVQTTERGMGVSPASPSPPPASPPGTGPSAPPAAPEPNPAGAAPSHS